MSATTCRVLFASLGVPTHVSCILILLIAIDRYRTVRLPCVTYGTSIGAGVTTGSSISANIRSRSLRPGSALLLVFLALLFSLLAAFPVAYYTGVQTVLPIDLEGEINNSQLAPFDDVLEALNGTPGLLNIIVLIFADLIWIRTIWQLCKRRN